MAVPFITILTILGGIGRHILSVPLIHKSVENYLDGTKTIWDNILWRALESAAGTESPSEREAEVVARSAQVQGAYDEVKQAACRGESMSVEAIKDVVTARGLPWIEQTTGDTI